MMTRQMDSEHVPMKSRFATADTIDAGAEGTSTGTDLGRNENYLSSCYTA